MSKRGGVGPARYHRNLRIWKIRISGVAHPAAWSGASPLPQPKPRPAALRVGLQRRSGRAGLRPALVLL